MNKFANYFDYAAATPMLPNVIESIQPYLSEHFYNPSALYLAAKSNKHVLESARQNVASGFGARPTEIVFTAGGTEANNLALFGILSQYPQGHLITSSIEHDSVLEPAKQYNHSIVKVNDKGVVSPEDILGLITDSTVLISIMYANNEVGALQPIKRIAELIEEVRKIRRAKSLYMPLYLHSDACQASNYLEMNVARLGVDLFTVNAGKIYGPKQCGALYVKAGIKLDPLIKGGGQEWNMRSGTENLANIVGFATAWAKARHDYHTESHRLSAIRDDFIYGIHNAVPTVTINGPLGSRRLANNVHLTFAGYDNERLLMELDERGFQVATGSACSASNDEPSHVLKAMGISDTAAQNSIRITFGRFTTKESALSLNNAISKIITTKSR